MKKILFLFLLLFLIASSANAYTLSVHQTNNSSRPIPLILYRFNDVNVSASYFDELNYCNVSTASGGLGSKGGLYSALSFTNGTSLWTNNFLNAYFPYLTATAGVSGCNSQYSNYNLTSGTFDFYTFSNSSLRTVGGNPQYIWRDSGGHFQILANSAANNLRFALSSPADGGTCDFISSFSISDNILHRHTFAFYKLSNGNTNGTYYFDGEYNQSKICLNTLQNNGTAFNIGGVSVSSNAFEGLIEEFSYYNANYSPNRIDGIALNCYDGTLNNTCSSINRGWFCNNGYSELDLINCPCSSTEFFNGTTCVNSNSITQTKLPLDLYIYDLGMCLTGENCPVFSILPAELFQVKYWVNKKLIGNSTLLGTDTDIVTANNASCSLIDLNPDLTETGFTVRLDFNKDKRVWENTGGNSGFNNKLIKIRCSSEIPNTNIENYFVGGNTKLGKDIFANSQSGTVGRMDGRVTDREIPVIYTLTTNDFYRPSSDSCLLNLQENEFYPQNGENFTSDYIINNGDFVKWEKIVNNYINYSGEFVYNWSCVNSPLIRYPSIKLSNSLLATQTCSNSELSEVKTIYSYYSGTQTNQSNKFYYGTGIIPIINYKLKDSPDKILDYECSLTTYNYSDATIVGFSKKWTWKNGIQNPLLTNVNYYSDYSNNYLPVGNYSFIYSCKNKDLGLCISPSTLNQTVEILATNGTGIPESCGIATAINCGYESVSCEIGTREIQKDCLDQTCLTNEINSCDECRKAGQEIYGLNLEIPSNLICGKSLEVKVTTLKSISPFNDNTTACVIQISNSKNELINTHNIGVTNGFIFNSTFNNLPCGQNLTVEASCYSENTCPNWKHKIKYVNIGSEIKCIYDLNTSGLLTKTNELGQVLVYQGCVSETTGKDKDKPYYCSEDSKILINSQICGCPFGYEKGQISLNKTNGEKITGCIKSKNILDAFTDYIFSGRFITLEFIGLSIIIIFLFVGYLKWKQVMG